MFHQWSTQYFNEREQQEWNPELSLREKEECRISEQNNLKNSQSPSGNLATKVLQVCPDLSMCEVIKASIHFLQTVPHSLRYSGQTPETSRAASSSHRRQHGAEAKGLPGEAAPGEHPGQEGEPGRPGPGGGQRGGAGARAGPADHVLQPDLPRHGGGQEKGGQPLGTRQ